MLAFKYKSSSQISTWTNKHLSTKDSTNGTNEYLNALQLFLMHNIECRQRYNKCYSEAC